jgi:hypothetical protein
MLVVPTTGPEAKKALHEALDPGEAATAVIYGDSARALQVAGVAEIRAAGHVERQVIRVPAVAVLAGDPAFAKLRQAAAGGAEATFLTLDLDVARNLRGVTALDAAEHEEAFAAALAGVIG